MTGELIEDLAAVAYPAPRHGEVEPPERYADVAAETEQRRLAYAEQLRTQVAETGDDALLTALRTAATQQAEAEDLVRRLMAYGRHCTGVRPDYTWHVLAEAAGMPYTTARRMITPADVEDVRDVLGSTRARWPEAMASLDVHRAYAELTAFGFDDVPQGLDHDAERAWWQDVKIPELHWNEREQQRPPGQRTSIRVIYAVNRWHTAWLRAMYPHAQRYRHLADQLRTLASALHHHDPAQRHITDESAQLTAIIGDLTQLRDSSQSYQTYQGSPER